MFMKPCSGNFFRDPREMVFRFEPPFLERSRYGPAVFKFWGKVLRIIVHLNAYFIREIVLGLTL